LTTVLTKYTYIQQHKTVVHPFNSQYRTLELITNILHKTVITSTIM